MYSIKTHKTITKKMKLSGLARIMKEAFLKDARLDLRKKLQRGRDNLVTDHSEQRHGNNGSHDVVGRRRESREELFKDKCKWNIMYVLKRRKGGQVEWDQIIEKNLESKQNPSF